MNNIAFIKEKPGLIWLELKKYAKIGVLDMIPQRTWNIYMSIKMLQDLKTRCHKLNDEISCMIHSYSHKIWRKKNQLM